MKPWKRIEPTIVSKIGWCTIVSKNFILPNGKTHHYQISGREGRQAAGVVALTSDKKVIVAQQFRPGPEDFFDEIPGGRVEEGEALEIAVRRELLEETGYEAGEIKYLGSTPQDAYGNATHHYFLATKCVPHKDGQNLDDTEFIEVKLISIDQLIDNAKRGRMTDPAAIMMAYDELIKLKEGAK